jgi:Protein of unknown function (DUF4231)
MYCLERLVRALKVEQRSNSAEPDSGETSTMDDLTPTGTATEPKHPTLERLEDQIGWYDKKSQAAQRRYKMLKFTQVIIAALIPLMAAFPIPEPQSRWVTAILGLLVLVIEAAQQINQYQQNWISYRSTCEALTHEKYLFLAEAGPYAGAAKPMTLLAQRIEGLISQEHAKWVSVQEQVAAKGQQATAPPSVSTAKGE